MRILLLGTRHNSLSQRVQVELDEAGHHIEVAEVDQADQMESAARRHAPELIVCPMLKRAIPATVWKRHTCLIVHPGIPGDRGPSALDWALLEGMPAWGVTVLEAREELDGGPIWAHEAYMLPAVPKSAVYRRETTDAAVRAVRRAVARFAEGEGPLADVDRSRGRERPVCRQAERRIDWSADGDELLRRIRSADSVPGLQAELAGVAVRLFGAWPEGELGGEPGQLLATRDGAVCVGTGNGALWISHLRRRFDDDARDDIKLPAVRVLDDRLHDVPERPIGVDAEPGRPTWQPIRYRRRGAIGHLYFDLMNGAMGTRALERLRAAYPHARAQDTKVLVLHGGADFWSNGIDLNDIEAADDPARASWENILAMNALVRDIICTDDQLVMSAVEGNAGAGGAILALAADRIVARDGVVFNPHYRRMGGLHGSEYWTYLLPHRVGEAAARQLTESLQPVGTARAERIGLIDAALPDEDFAGGVEQCARELADAGSFATRIGEKRRRRVDDEARKPLEQHAGEELTEMRRNFFGADRSYHDARRAFVRKQPIQRTVTVAERA